MLLDPSNALREALSIRLRATSLGSVQSLTHGAAFAWALLRTEKRLSAKTGLGPACGPALFHIEPKAAGCGLFGLIHPQILQSSSHIYRYYGQTTAWCIGHR